MSDVPEVAGDQVPEVVEELDDQRAVPAQRVVLRRDLRPACRSTPRRMAPGLPPEACTSRKLITTAASTVPTAMARRRAT